jgi:hypothetical protein
LNDAGEAVYYVTADDVVLLAGKVGVTMTKAIAEEWLRDPKSRVELTAAIDEHIKHRMRWL